MNFLKRLFKKKIEGKELDELILSLGKDKNFVYGLGKHQINEYTTLPFAYLDVKKKPGYGVEFNLEVHKKYFHRGFIKKGGSLQENDTISSDSPPIIVTLGIPYKELNKNPVLKKYVKGKNLEKSLAVLSVASILASAFFISNNITGNAILTATSNDSGLIGAGLFVLGLISFIFARNI